MSQLPDLRTALLDLLYETRGEDLKLIIGGGFGIYLKREHVRESRARTLLSEWPEARSTNDLDLFLRAELLIESKRLKVLAKAISRLGYAAVATARNYQFAKPGPGGGAEGGLRIDILTGPQSHFKNTKVKAKDRRVRPKPSVGIHARYVDEALTLEERLRRVAVEGLTSGGVVHSSHVYLPHPLSFAMMKLFAYRDREDDPEKDLGSYHALDLYAVLATATEPEWEEALRLCEKHGSHPKLTEAAQIVEEKFSKHTAKGILRLKQSPYFRPELQLDPFIGALRELFPSPGRGST